MDLKAFHLTVPFLSYGLRIKALCPVTALPEKLLSADQGRRLSPKSLTILEASLSSLNVTGPHRHRDAP